MPNPLRRPLFVGILLAMVTSLASLPELPAEERKVDETVAKLYHRLLRSSLWVGARREKPDEDGKKGWSTGSASLIDPKNHYVLTNWHVVQDENIVFVCFPTYANNQLVSDRRFYLNILQKGAGGRGKVIARDPKCDLAVIQMDILPQGAMALPLAKEETKKGDRVHSIGNPGAEDRLWICTSRTVQDISFIKIQTGAKDGGPVHRFEAKWILTDVPSKEGESGGPLVNDRGELVGVTQGYRPETRQGIYVSLSEVKDFLARHELLAKVLASAPRDPIAKPPDTTTTKPPEKPPAKPLSPAEEKEQEAERKFRFARNLIEARKTERAVELLKEIIKTYPETSTAGQAERLLKTLK